LIRVAVVIEALGRGGAERLVVDTARRLDPKQFALQIYTLYAARRDYEGALREIGVPETCLGLEGLGGSVSAALRLAAIFRRERPDVVHTHLFGANLVGRWAARLARCPVVSTYHDADYEPVVRIGNPTLTPFKQRVLQMLDALTVAATNPRHVAVSEYVADSVRRRIRADGVRVIPNGVDPSVFHPDAEGRKRARAQLELPASTGVVACVGRMTPQKGQATLIRAMPRILEARADTRLLLVGDGPDQAALRQLASGLSLDRHVAFLGVRPDVPEVLRAADVLAVPSLHEGFGLVLIEALATGVPVVASRTGPIPEIIDDGVSGLLVPVGDPPALAEAIRSLLTDEARWRSLSLQGRREVEARFDIQAMLSALERLYREMVAERDPRTRRT